MGHFMGRRIKAKFAIATIAATVAPFAQVIGAGVLRAFDANALRFLFTDTTDEMRGYVHSFQFSNCV